ncbi:MAG: PadR family transcriptional regulator [Candidatus Xenobiia bacterium LiM19]
MGRRGCGRGNHGGRGGHGHPPSGEGSPGFFEPSSSSPRFIEPVLLMLLAKMGESYGYQLITEAEKLSFSGMSPDSGSIYRILRRMEMENLVNSFWDFSVRGPARRQYRITERGTAVLNDWIEFLKRHRDALNYFISIFNGM